jgi:hypothetical protein
MDYRYAQLRYDAHARDLRRLHRNDGLVGLLAGTLIRRKRTTR